MQIIKILFGNVLILTGVLIMALTAIMLIPFFMDKSASWWFLLLFLLFFSIGKGFIDKGGKIKKDESEAGRPDHSNQDKSINKSKTMTSNPRRKITEDQIIEEDDDSDLDLNDPIAEDPELIDSEQGSTELVTIDFTCKGCGAQNSIKANRGEIANCEYCGRAS